VPELRGLQKSLHLAGSSIQDRCRRQEKSQAARLCSRRIPSPSSRRRIQVGPQLPSGPEKLSRIAETKRTRTIGGMVAPIDMAPMMDRTPRSTAHAHTRPPHPLSAAPAASRQMTTMKPDHK
jgi:hypothetical protein